MRACAGIVLHPRGQQVALVDTLLLCGRTTARRRPSVAGLSRSPARRSPQPERRWCGGRARPVQVRLVGTGDAGRAEPQPAACASWAGGASGVVGGSAAAAGRSAASRRGSPRGRAAPRRGPRPASSYYGLSNVVIVDPAASAGGAARDARRCQGRSALERDRALSSWRERAAGELHARYTCAPGWKLRAPGALQRALRRHAGPLPGALRGALPGRRAPRANCACARRSSTAAAAGSEPDATPGGDAGTPSPPQPRRYRRPAAPTRRPADPGRPAATARSTRSQARGRCTWSASPATTWPGWHLRFRTTPRTASTPVERRGT